MRQEVNGGSFVPLRPCSQVPVCLVGVFALWGVMACFEASGPTKYDRPEAEVLATGGRPSPADRLGDAESTGGALLANGGAKEGARLAATGAEPGGGGMARPGGMASDGGGGMASAGGTASDGGGGMASGDAGGARPAAGTGGVEVGGGAGSEGGAGSPAGDCTGLPPSDDYSAPGPFDDVIQVTNTGPGGNYTLFRPGESLGQGGFRHPIATWGNGITTTPDMYASTLTLLASHGFVVIACDDTEAEGPCLSAGLDWLVEQNAAGKELAGKLDTTREVTLGYSWGGGAAIDSASRPQVRATISLHGMPPRGATAFEDMKSPLLLLTSTGDTFVSAKEYVTPNFEGSRVPTFYATLEDPLVGHLYVVDEGAPTCLGALLGLGTCRNAELEQGPVVAWMRYWACGDAAAREYFFGDSCVLCSSPWGTPRLKDWQ